jgi:predicted nucleotide-binding protein
MKQIGKEQALKLLIGQLNAMNDLRGQTGEALAFKSWKQMTSLYLEKAFGEESKNAKAFEKIHYFPMAWADGMDENYWYPRAFIGGLNEAEVLLKRCVQELELFGETESKPVENRDPKTQSSIIGKKVFVVHGHDEKLKTQVARFLEKLELQPIILHEQPDRGQTIIEKFEKHSDVSFAVVLLTPDDFGGKPDGEKLVGAGWRLGAEKVEGKSLQKRARQNVIFEFGYFIGKLGRENVCGLYCDGVELPSDYSGVLYTKVDADGAWQFKLLKELKAAGFSVDANRLA